ncbi:MAG TPA: hypothetical protein VHW71_07535 [Steroidobacteraceae bacterium]|jgi:hypothetical protein|nr:hypothetical protein [Steroidobacteraceae bacterium]
MKIRKTAPVLIIIAFGGISPALADCCSSWLDCAAAVVTDGLSCEIETIISTINSLFSMISNLVSDINGQMQTAENGARQSVTDRYNALQTGSQQASADLAQAQAQANQLYQEESAILAVQRTTAAGAGAVQAASTTPASSGANQPTVVHTQSMAPAAQTAPAQSGLLLRGVTAQRTTAVTAPPGNGTPVNPAPQKSMAPLNAKDSVSIESQMAPHGQFADAFSRGLKFITTLNGTGAGDLTQINQDLANAMASEGSGLTAADIIGKAMNAPLAGIESELSSMLANPLSAFDPSSAVDSMDNSITASLSTNISTVIDDITTGPNQAFDAAGPSYDDLMVNTQRAQAVAAAMNLLYTNRTTAAATALYALLPKVEYASQITKAPASSQVAAGFGQRMSSAKISANFVAAKKKILVAVRPLNVAPIHAAIAQFKAQRAQGKSAQTPSMLATYRSNTTRQLDSYFAGKPPAAIASTRDQLIAQARTKFAKDQKTGNGVIALINSEAQKQGGPMTAAAPGQSVPTMATGAAATGAAATGAAAATVPRAAPTSTIAPSNLVPVQQKAAWGTTPAWKPPLAAGASPVAVPAATAAPTAPHVVTAIKPAIALKTIQPVQRPVQQPATVQAPSSMPSNP